ncbi:MAG: recombination regulator RecX [Chloroflexi bacterium]|nr:recombination regulator RecX [Chloroflexota bacterium]
MINDSGPIKRATATALRYISGRPRSEAEVRKRLLRGFPSGVVEQVIADLNEQSLIDDAGYAKLWAASRDSLKPRSAYAIKRELASKGISGEAADAATRELDDDDSAYRAAASHARRLYDADYSAFSRRMWAYLQRRGYSASVARRTVARLWQELNQGDK